MAIRVVRLGTPRLPDEGTRLGTVRRPPRGVRKEDFARRDWFDLWLPDMAPTAAVVTWAQSDVQPAVPLVSPVSHASPASTVPSPHTTLDVHGAPGVAQTEWGST